MTTKPSSKLSPVSGAMRGLGGLLAFTLISLAPNRGLAQTTPWTGNDVSSITLSGVNNSGDTIIFLYNVATGMYLNQGGYWGTTPDVRDVGSPCQLYSYSYSRSGDSGASGDNNGGDNNGGGPGGNNGGDNNGGGPGGNGKLRAISSSSLSTYGTSTSSFPYQLSAGVQKANDEGNTENIYDAFLGFIPEEEDRGPVGYDNACAMLDCTTGQGYTGVAFVQTDESTDTIRYYIALYCAGLDSTDVTLAGTSQEVVSDSIYYLFAELNADSTEYVVKARKSGNIPDDSLAYAMWQIITRQNLIDRFEETEGSFADPVDATFMLSDPNFHRRNLDINDWTITHSSGSANNGWNIGWTEENDIVDNQVSSDTATVYVGMGFHDNIAALANSGRFSDSDGQGAVDGLYERYFCRLYGKYYDGNIFFPASLSSTDSISVMQEVATNRAGWYEISCKGFYFGNTVGWLEATVEGAGESNTTPSAQVALYKLDSTDAFDSISFSGSDVWGDVKITTSSDSVTALACLQGAQLITDLTTYETYEAIAYVYVDATSVSSNEGTITLGITAQNTTSSALGWVAFDDMRLRYLGNVTEFIVLNDTDQFLAYNKAETKAESSSGKATYLIGLNEQLENAITYGKTQDEATPINGMSNYALVLARPLVDGEWNSIILPVDLTPSQLTGAFGANYRLAQFTGVDVGTNNSQTIKFTSVAHTESLQAGYLYIVKPVSSNLTAVDSETGFTGFTTPLPSDGSTTTDYQKDVYQSYYLIPQVSFPEAAVDSGTYAAELTNTGIEAKSSDGTLYFHGTYIKQASRVPTGSYVVGRTTDDDGNYTYGFYHYTGTNNLTIKGFRTWIDNVSGVTVQSDGDASDEDEGEASSLVYFTIDGSVDPTLNDAVSTGIVSLPISTGSSATTANARTDNRVYSLSGQLLREGSSLEGLGQGVYIVNGEKYIVK